MPASCTGCYSGRVGDNISQTLRVLRPAASRTQPQPVAAQLVWQGTLGLAKDTAARLPPWPASRLSSRLGETSFRSNS